VSGKNYIEIYNYENNIDKAVSLRPKMRHVGGEEGEIEELH